MKRAKERALERCPLELDTDTITASRNENRRAIFALLVTMGAHGNGWIVRVYADNHKEKIKYVGETTVKIK